MRDQTSRNEADFDSAVCEIEGAARAELKRTGDRSAALDAAVEATQNAGERFGWAFAFQRNVIAAAMRRV